MNRHEQSAPSLEAAKQLADPLVALETHIPPDAPSDFVEPVVAIRGVLLEKGSGYPYGCCIQTSLVLGWLLREQGYTVELVSCTAKGWPHWCVRVEGWMLDPAAGQFGEDNPPLLFDMARLTILTPRARKTHPGYATTKSSRGSSRG